MIKMAQLEDIRKMYFMEELNIREISRRTGIHRDNNFQISNHRRRCGIVNIFVDFAVFTCSLLLDGTFLLDST